MQKLFSLSQPAQVSALGETIDTRGPIMAGLVVLIVILGGFGGWSTFATLASAVVAPGTITVDTNRKEVRHLEGGIIREILVRNGDYVTQGQALARLDETRASAGLGIMQVSFDSAQAAIARLQAEQSSAADIRFPDELVARGDDPRVAEALAGERALFDARRQSLDGQRSMLDERIGQLREEITGLAAQEESMRRQLTLIEDELAGLKELNEKGYAPRTRILALEREAERLRGERGEDAASIASARGSISELELEKLQLLKSFQEEVQTALREREREVEDIRERLMAQQFTVDTLEVVAPASGVVVNSTLNTIGGVVAAGETLMEIVPDDDRLIIEASIRPIDIDEVAVGLSASIQLTAFSTRDLPTLEGEVIYVSADSMLDERNELPFFAARVAIPDDQVERLAAVELRPGMPADVLIKTGERTPMSYLLKPLTSAINKAWREQ